MKLKDIPINANMNNCKVKTSNGVVGYWKSQWNKGVWLSDGVSSKIYPQFVDDLKDCLEWEVTDEPVNCHIKKDYNHLNNKKTK